LNAEIISVGTELLLGDIVNLDAQFLSRELALLGINVHYQSTTGDNEHRIAQSIDLAKSRCDIIILSGGLGPTEDDITKETLASFLGLPLKEDHESLEAIESHFDKIGVKMSGNNKKQALIIEGATVFKNEFGTAPGMAVEHEEKTYILLPGPPRELIPMFINFVQPFLSRHQDGVITSKTVNVFGLGESRVGEILGELLKNSNPTVATYAKDGETLIRVTAKAQNKDEADKILNPFIEEIKKRLGFNVYGIDAKNMQSVVVDLLKKHNLKAATAESCTAGLLSKKITEISGASDVFELGVTTYSNENKINILKVKKQTIEKYGAVSIETASAMALGVRHLANASIGVSITGIAGPDGGTEDKPVGLVYIAVSDGNYVWIKRMQAASDMDRDYIRNLATLHAFDIMRKYLINLPGILIGGEPLRGHNANPSFLQSVLPDFVDDKEVDSRILQQEAPVLHTNSKSVPKATEEQPSLRTEANAESRFNEIVPEDDINISSSSAPDIQKYIAAVKRFFINALPSKNDDMRENIRKSVFLIAFLTFVVSLAILINQVFIAPLFNKNLNNSFKNLKTASAPPGTVIPEGASADFAALYAKNSDFRGWITIPDTEVDYPVTWSDKENGEYYLTRDFNGKKNSNGTLFFDVRNRVENNANNKNLIIYGHDMRSGQMFGSLKKYKSLEYYRDHPLITMDTLYEKANWKIFAVFYANVNEEQGKPFNYIRTQFANGDDFLDFTDNMKIRSLFELPVDILPDDQILTLSTCTDDIKDGRFVIAARKIREDEDSMIDLGNTRINPNPMYPDVWYTKRGKQVPDFSSKLPNRYNGGIPNENRPVQSYPIISIDPFSSELSSDVSSIDSLPSSSESSSNAASSTSSSTSSGTTTPSSSEAPKPSSSAPPPASSSQAPSPAPTPDPDPVVPDPDPVESEEEPEG